MNRAELQEKAESFLKCQGYRAKTTSVDNAIIFTRPTGMGVEDELLVYFHEKGEEKSLVGRLTILDEKYKKIMGGDSGRRFFLTSSPLGTIPKPVIDKGFKYQVPVWFFDREFSADKKSTPLKHLEEEASKYVSERVDQPYFSNSKETGKDLLTQLLNELENPKVACLRVVIAPAGYGKTVLMGTLYTKLRDRFIERKNKQETGMRPLLMLPGHLKKTADVDSLINNFISDEYDYGVSHKETFKFWVKNNFAVWLVDGLEELILKIPEEFIYTLLEEYIYASNSVSPQIIISIRKPVLATLPELKETIDEWEGRGIKVYELCAWGQEQIESYFRKNLKADQIDVENFLKDIMNSDPLNKLCSVPYYCSLVAELKNNNKMQIFNDDCELVEHAVKKMCEREFSKGLDNDLFPVNTQIKLLAELAEESFRSDKVSKDMLKELAEIELSNIAEDERKNQMECWQRHGMLTQIGEDLDFIHDIIKQYLTSIRLLDNLKNLNLKTFGVKEIELQSFMARYLIKSASDIHWNDVLERIFEFSSSPTDKAIGFRNILKILLSANIEGIENLIKDKLHSSNLTGLIFKDLDMHGFQFHGSRLDSVRFEKCNLSGANFNGCHFKNTFFDDACDLKGATTKDAIFDAIIIGNKSIYDKKEIDRFFYEKTEVASPRCEPCQSAINLKRILEKIIRKGAGIKIPQKWLMQTKCSGGISAQRCVSMLLRNRILIEEGEKVKIKTNLFDEAKDFVANLSTTNNDFQKLLDEICPDTKTGCRHLKVSNYGKE